MRSPFGAKKQIYFWERIAFRISLGFTLPILVSAWALTSTPRIYMDVAEVREHSDRVWNSIRSTNSQAILTLTKMRANAAAYQYDRSPELAQRLRGQDQDYFLDLENSRKNIEMMFSENVVPFDVSIGRSYAQLNELHKDFSRSLENLIRAVDTGNTAEFSSARREIERTWKESENQILRLQAQTDRAEGNLSARIQAEEIKLSRTLDFYLIAVLMFGIVAAIGVTLSITGPIRKVLYRIKDIATGDGDLTKRVYTRVGGEMRELTDWLNIFLEKTHGVVATISHASQTIHGTSNQVSSHTEKMTIAAAGINKSMMEQSMNIDECTNRIDHIDDLLQNSGESTRQAASLSKIAMDRALQGGASVHETLEAMEKIQDSAHKVEELLSSINDIASQTNLLAINAAIEATKAGDHGKGFAVVAEEVRKLAERARRLTGEVTGLVSESSGRVKAGVGLAKTAGVALDGIIKDVEAVVSLIQRIAAASAKQTESSTVVLEFMQKVSEAVRLNLQDMEGVTKASEYTVVEVSKLNILVGQLNEVVGQFRIGTEHIEHDPVRSFVSIDPEATKAMQPENTRSIKRPGELSLEAMLNPGSSSGIPSERPKADIRGLAPLPPGAAPSAEGDEDAA